jgi:hypothetical protein
MQSESREDVENIEAWAEVIREMLCCVPSERRSAVLALATKNEEAARQEREWKRINLASSVDWKQHSANRYRNTIERLKSLVVQVFVRSITSINSAEDAAQILFTHRLHGLGSRRLQDYLRYLPTPRNHPS